MADTDKKEALCPECNKNVEYVIEEVDDSVELKGRTVFFRGQRAVCPECGSEIWVGAVDDRNMAAAREAYCRDRGVMTPKEVEAVTEKYDIGARPLARLLGWGAVTIARFIAGDIPSRAYSDRLRELADDEDEYRELVEKNKQRISRVAYRKTMARLDAGCGGTAAGGIPKKTESGEGPGLLSAARAFGESLRDARVGEGITRERLADLSGVSPADIGRIENGEADPSLKTLERVADALGCELRLVPKA